jgi:hypothetical protein
VLLLAGTQRLRRIVDFLNRVDVSRIKIERFEGRAGIATSVEESSARNRRRPLVTILQSGQPGMREMYVGAAIVTPAPGVSSARDVARVADAFSFVPRAAP